MSLILTIMHDRHTNRERYFNEQVFTTTNYVIPYLKGLMDITTETTVAEIGCGEGGNLLPFLDLGCKIIGIDLAVNKIENAKKFFDNHPNKDLATFIAEDIYKVNPADYPQFDLIIMRDAIEHIPNQEVFLENLKQFLSPKGIVFFAFPPWRMPFGGHQQICRNRYLSKLPYFHLLPNFLYVGMLKIFGETQQTIDSLIEIKDTGISISRFERIVKNCNYKVDKKTYFMVNPNYEIKFKLKTRILPRIMNIPHFRDFFTTTMYCVISKN